MLIFFKSLILKLVFVTQRKPGRLKQSTNKRWIGRRLEKGGTGWSHRILLFPGDILWYKND